MSDELIVLARKLCPRKRGGNHPVPGPAAWCEDLDHDQLASLVTAWMNNEVTYLQFSTLVHEIQSRNGRDISKINKSNVQAYLPTALRKLGRMGYTLELKKR